LDDESGETFCIQEDRFPAVECQKSLRVLLGKHPGEKLVAVLDNARNHHSEFLKSFLAKNCQFLKLVFLPTYSPDLNTIEEI